MTPDTAFDLVADAHRRVVLYHLIDGDGTATRRELVERIASWEEARDSDDSPEGIRRRVAINLAHVHLPKLSEAGIVEYDARGEDVALADGAADLAPLLELARPADDFVTME
ncbi:hypothetical protein ACFQPA_07825 [Halomarina halobia]|uniref:DUF7344 domain-containing protein n=1 Tax=Halomarina halobia TaxID=3033386 RepID=A0ABD6ABR3_9EURY|nr:hypothetical protein [Halomarina sp. PSR21]